MDSRRSFLKKTGFLAGTAAASPLFSSADFLKKNKKGRALRIAHITDVHIQNEPAAVQGLRNLFKSINSLKDKPDFIVNTGDTVYEANRRTEEYVNSCWETWKEIEKAENRLPIYSVLGNHDNWFGSSELNELYRHNPNYRKNWAIKELNMPSRYYSFEAENWIFFALDSIADFRYSLDKRQFEWLKEKLELLDRTKHACILSHVPIISAASMMYMMQQRKESAKFHFPYEEIHNDGLELKDLFYEHPQVKICLSGHTHYIDRVDYLNVSYCCNGAASGSWWKGSLQEFPPVYAVIDLYKDGRTECTIVPYNWDESI